MTYTFDIAMTIGINDKMFVDMIIASVLYMTSASINMDITNTICGDMVPLCVNEMKTNVFDCGLIDTICITHLITSGMDTFVGTCSVTYRLIRRWGPTVL